MSLSVRWRNSRLVMWKIDVLYLQLGGSWATAAFEASVVLSQLDLTEVITLDGKVC